MLSKVADKLMGYSQDSLASNMFAVEQGKLVETIAVPWYEFTYDVKIQRVGFCVSDDGRYGCSPDGLIGEDGGIEIKSPQPGKHLQHLLGGIVPKEYVGQVQMSLFVTGRAWWKFVSYSRHLPPLVLHVTPDLAIQAALKASLELFVKDFDAYLAKIKALQGTP